MGGLRSALSLRLSSTAAQLYPPPDDPAQIKPINHPTGSAAMAVSQAIPITRHPFANGSYERMLIDGKWVDAASGKRFETHNPAPGELLATVAEGDAEDINRAVAAARRAFESP